MDNAGVYSSGDKLSSQVWSKGTSISQFCDNVLVANNWVFVIDTRGNSRRGYVHSYYRGDNGIYDISNVSLMAEGDGTNEDFGKIAAYHNNTVVFAGGSGGTSVANYIKIYSLPLDAASEVTTTTTVITNNTRETLKLTDKGDISGNDASFNNIQFLGKILKEDGTEFVGGGGGTTYDSTTDITVKDATLNGDLTIGNSNQVLIKTTGGKILNTGIGINSTYSDFLNLQHTAFGSGSTSDNNSYALMQNSTGDTYLNCVFWKTYLF